jgi:hypothetical protein
VWKDERLLHLQLAGDLPAEWGLHLARALAARGVSVRSGYARRIECDDWLAELMLEMWRGEPLPDFLSFLSGRPPVPILVEPRILDFELCASEAFPGALELQVDGWDEIGLLATVLGRCAAAGLAPEEIVLEAQEGCAFQNLTLRSRTGGCPSWLQQIALERALGALRSGA